MVLNRVALLFILIINTSLADTEIAKHGEINFDNYFGPEDPRFNYDPYRNKLNFIDDDLVNKYSEDKISDEIRNLESFFKQDFYLGLNCPDSAFTPKYHYLEYLSRLQVISYLFQSLREHDYLSKKFKFKNSCEVNWNQLIKGCSPVTKEMKSFKRDAQLALKSLKKVVVPFEQSGTKQLKTWLDDYSSKKLKTLTHYRLGHNCKNKNCGEMTKKKLNKELSLICHQERDLFSEICSERDALQGVSFVPEIYHLIGKSSGIRGIDQDGFGAGCLARYIEQNRNNEKKVFFLKDIFSVLFEHNMTYSPDNPQGRLFTIGAVKEFTDKGLAGIFSVKKKTSKPKTKVTKDKKIITLSNPEFEKIVLPKFKKKKKLKKVKTKRVKKKVVIKEKKSSFLILSEFRKKFDLAEVELNMNKFKYDYIFTLSQVKKIENKVIKFSSIKSLKAMLKFDKLGTKKSPIPLKFIKFLIDNDHHKNLFNITTVVGESFYIFNDIDIKYRSLDIISLKNDISTNFKWKIKIVKP